MGKVLLNWFEYKYNVVALTLKGNFFYIGIVFLNVLVSVYLLNLLEI